MKDELQQLKEGDELYSRYKGGVRQDNDSVPSKSRYPTDRYKDGIRQR